MKVPFSVTNWWSEDFPDVSYEVMYAEGGEGMPPIVFHRHFDTARHVEDQKILEAR